MNTFESVRSFVYRNARPLDLARWQYHFENGSQAAVINALKYYQNADGGFGHAIEPDCWNVNSSPIATWMATCILREVGVAEGDIIDGILRYLESGADFDEAQNQWLNSVPSNNDYPHAVWWGYSEGGELMYNPTASLAGFIIRFADKSSALYKKGSEIACEAYKFFEKSVPFGEQHITACFIELYDYCREAGVELFDMERFKELLITQVHNNICQDTAKWAVEYVARPIEFFNTRDSIFYPDNRDIAEYQCEFIVSSQLPDGSYPVTWSWWNDYKEFEISANWWRVSFAINNILYLKNFGKLLS
ncbi:MAG: hypothetical protein HFE63_07100 [Clostridiales bacterium]|nr:hypothetical protein [Clostridiales bacterium]